jgi:hypothetical protein
MLAVVKLVRRRLYQCRDGIYGGCSIALKLVMANDLRRATRSCICWEKYSRYLDDD